MSAAPKETKRREREDEGDRSKRKRHREERQAELQAVQAAGEEQARKALQEKARKEREANEQWDEICRRATSLRATRLQPGPPPPCPDSWLNTTLPRNHSPSSSSSSSSTAEQPCKRGQRCVSEGSVNNDQDQDFQRQLALVQEEKAEDHKRRSQQACQHRLLVRLLVLLLLLLLCFVLGVLPQHYFPMDVSTEIFPTRAFQMGVSGVHAGVWGVLTEKFHSSKLIKGGGGILREILSSQIRTKSGGACSIGTRKGVSGSGSPRDRNGVENGGRKDATFLRPPW